jgi:TIR domain
VRNNHKKELFEMITHSFFISHSSATKELARHIYYNGIANGLSVWYDEGLLEVGDLLIPDIEKGIYTSAGFLLLHCKQAIEKQWVPMEMKIAKEKYEKDSSTKIIVVKLDDQPLNDPFWEQFIYANWNPLDQPGSILKLLEVLTGRKGVMAITASAMLTRNPSDIFLNETATIAEHTRNFILWYFGHVKQLIYSSVSIGNETELRDTLGKILHLSLFENIPLIQGGLVPVEPGLFEIIHPVRMFRIPDISIVGLPSRYSWEKAEANEVFTRVRIIDSQTSKQVSYPVPLAISVMLEAEL